MCRLIRVSLVVLLGCLLIALPAHLWISDSRKVLKVLYPLEALLVSPTVSCSSSAPDWLWQATQFSLWGNLSPAGQLVHVDADGLSNGCHYGWHGYPLFSSRVNEDSRFRYASMTKLLTADWVLRFVRDDRLMLDGFLVDRLAVSAERVDERVSQMSVAQLLRHSFGFDRLKSVDPMLINNKKPWCPYTLVPLANAQLDFTPGERYAYHNLNYCLLGMLLEQADPQRRSFREQMEQEYALAERGIRFIDGPYLDDEVTYDFRNSGFYGPNYWKYFDFYALSSSMGLSGSAQALANLIASLKDESGDFPITQAPREDICDETVKRGCYGYALFSYQPVGGSLRVHVQPGLLYGAPSLAIIDEHGGVTVWVGNGTRPSGSSTDAMLDHLYSALEKHYADHAQ